MRLIHYSREPLTAVYSRPHSDHGTGAFKTPGLWVSVEGPDDWPAWCEAESFGADRLEYATEVVLAHNANVLVLSGAAALDEFTARFSVPLYSGASRDGIDWVAVRAAGYQGVIIAPYCYERRYDLMWYYGWDCASGVIWDAAAIAHLIPIETHTPKLEVAQP